VIFLNLWPWPLTFYVIFLKQVPSSMDYVCTSFGCDSSSCLLFRAWTHRHTKAQTPLITISYTTSWRLGYRLRAGTNNWHDMWQLLMSVMLISCISSHPTSFFTARYMPSSCVCVSVTLRYCIKTAKRRITHITPHDSPGTLVFWHQSSRRNSKGITPYGSDKCRLGGLKLASFDEKRAINLKRYKIDAYSFY